MKKIIFVSSVLAILLMSGAAFAQTSGSSVGVSVLKQDPAPAEAGKFLEIWLSVTKIGNVNLNNYVVEIVPEFPFYLAAGEDAIKEFPIIDSNGATAKFELRVAEDAPNGDATLKVRNYVKGAAPTSGGAELTIPILGKVDLSIKSVQPSDLIPGQPTKVKFLLENTGNAPVRDLIITWTDSGKSILPLAGENRYRVDNIGIGESRNVSFDMIADPAATQGVKVIDVTMTFQRFGESDSRTSQVAFIVGGLTDFDVAQNQIEADRLAFSVANIGVNSATGVLLSLPEQPGWKILGSSDVFLGNLESGDFTVATVDVSPLSQEVRQTVKVVVKYTDTVGIRRTTEKEVVINLSNILSKGEGGSQDYTSVIVVVIIVLLVGFWYVNRRLKIIARFTQPKRHGK